MKKQILKKIAALSLTATMVISLAGCSGSAAGTETSEASSADAAAPAEDTSASMADYKAVTQISKDTGSTTEKKDITVAVALEPPMLDPTLTTSIAARDITKYIYEGLVEMDAAFEPQLQLAESYEASEDNKTWTFKLRQGVKFHDGSEMTSEDVAASLNRWAAINGSAGSIIGESQFTSTDDYTVTITLAEPCVLFLYYLANPSQFAGITTKEIVESADETGGFQEFIGTGSLKYKEWKSNESIVLEKFEDYSAPEAPLSGFSGDKSVTFDTVTFNFVTDDATRVAAALTEEYDIVENITQDNLAQFEGSETTLVPGSYYEGGLVFEKQEGSGSYSEDPLFRQAVMTALDVTSIVSSAFPDADYYDLDSNYMAPFQTAWHVDEAVDQYLTGDADKAKELLEQSSYDGGTVRMVTTQQYMFMYNETLIVEQALEAIGIDVEVEVLDWPTMLQRINQPETLDMFISSFGISPIPGTLLFLSPVRTGFTNNPELQTILESMNTAASIEDAQTIWKDGQMKALEAAEFLPLSHFNYINGLSSDVAEYTAFCGVSLWGIKVTE